LLLAKSFSPLVACTLSPVLSPVPFLWNFSLVPCVWKLACALPDRYRYIFSCFLHCIGCKLQVAILIRLMGHILKWRLNLFLKNAILFFLLLV